jgi:hypothetical protein
MNLMIIGFHKPSGISVFTRRVPCNLLKNFGEITLVLIAHHAGDIDQWDSTVSKKGFTLIYT